MKKNDFSSDQEFEKILKEKMNELSASVDCFDKISARAFPEKDSDFSECGFTVSDLENVTGKRRFPPVLRWVSAAAAIVLCIGVIPKTAIINSLRDPAEKSSGKSTYTRLLSEIKDETQSGSYYICDLSLDDYISRDVLVTPLYSCPFEESNEDMNVRLYIRYIGGIRTNQIYAVKYRGTYSEDNIVAAAETGVSFSEKEEEILEQNPTFSFSTQDNAVTAVSAAFRGTNNGQLIDHDGNEVSAASFSGFSLYKKGKNTETINTDVVYYRSSSDETYYYDTLTTGSSNNVIDIARDSWETSVSSDGSAENPADNTDVMTRTQLFTGTYENKNNIWYFTPTCVYPWIDENVSLPENEYITEVHNSYETTGKILSQIALPDDTSFQRSLNVYIGQKSPIALYPENHRENKQFYSTLSLECIFYSSITANTISTEFDKLENELTHIRLSEKNETIMQASKEALELEEQKILAEMKQLQQHVVFLEETEKALNAEEERQNAEAAEKRREEIENYQKKMQDILTDRDQNTEEAEQNRQNAEEALKKLLENQEDIITQNNNTP